MSFIKQTEPLNFSPLCFDEKMNPISEENKSSLSSKKINMLWEDITETKMETRTGVVFLEQENIFDEDIDELYGFSVACEGEDKFAVAREGKLNSLLQDVLPEVDKIFSERSLDGFSVAHEGKLEKIEKNSLDRSEGKLIFTSICMPTILYLLAHKYHVYNPYLASITTIGSFFSVLFWMDPIKNKNKLIHKLDAVMAKFVIMNYTIYKLYINQNNLFFFLCSYVPMLYYFDLSNRFSSKHWCSKPHIKAHVTAHLYCMLCLYISFFEKDIIWEYLETFYVKT